MKVTVSILDISLFLIAFILLAGLFLFTSGGCAGVSTEPGKSVNPADIPKAPGANTVEPRFAPNPYTDDVIQLKQKMRDSEDKQPQCDRDKKGGEVDKNQ